jgi:molybdate transport system ATP-binding protein
MVMPMNPRRPGTFTPATDEPVLFRLEQATLRVGAQRLLTGTTWNLCAGQNWVILGANGSGKTTLAGTLTGETPVVAGRRWVDRNRLDPSKVRTVSFESHQRLIARDESQDEARCFAQQALRGMRVSTILAPARAAGGADHMVLETWMRQAGLWDLRDRPVRHLSSGEMRQVMIARALLDTPRLLIIDEPFDGLDPFARRGLAAMLSRLMAGGLQIVLITHHLDEVLPEITHYLLLRDGRVVEQGPWRPQGRVQMPLQRATGPGAAGFAGSGTRADDVAPEKASRDLIRMCAVTVAYEGRRVLDRLNWCVRPGENWAICGPNGAGKSTVLQLVCGDHPQAYANEIYLFGRRRGSGETIWDVKRPIGMVSHALQIRYRKPLDGLGVILSGYFDSVGLYRQARAEQVAAARRLAKRLAVGHLLGSDFSKMSNGERRMLLIARAMIKQPVLLLLDEPCQGLDSANRQYLLAMLATILATSPTQLLYVSHRPDEIPAGTTHELHLALDGTYRIHRRHQP